MHLPLHRLLSRFFAIGALPLLGCVGEVPAPQTVTDITVGVNAAMCVMDTYAADVAAGKSKVDAVADAALKCGLSVVETTGVLDHAKAMQDKADSVPDAGQ